MSPKDGGLVVGPVVGAPEEAAFDVEEPPDHESEESGEQAESGEDGSGEGAGLDCARAGAARFEVSRGQFEFGSSGDGEEIDVMESRAESWKCGDGCHCWCDSGGGWHRSPAVEYVCQARGF